MSKRTRSRTGVEAKRRRARIARRVAKVRGFLLADMFASAYRGTGVPAPPYWPGRDRYAALRWSQLVRVPHRQVGERRRPMFDASQFFDVLAYPSDAGTFSNLFSDRTPSDLTAAMMRYYDRTQERRAAGVGRCSRCGTLDVPVYSAGILDGIVCLRCSP